MIGMKVEERELLRGKVGRPQFKDSGVLTLVLSADCIPYLGDYQYVEFLRANHGELFPCSPDQSQYNRRCRNVCHMLESLRRYWLSELGVLDEAYFLLDTKSVPVVGYRHSKSHSDFAGTQSTGIVAVASCIIGAINSSC